MGAGSFALHFPFVGEFLSTAGYRLRCLKFVIVFCCFHVWQRAHIRLRPLRRHPSLRLWRDWEKCNRASGWPGLLHPIKTSRSSETLAEPADSVSVQEGDVVHKGQVLAVLDTSDLEAQLRADEATANSNSATTSHDVYQGSLAIAQGSDTLRSAVAAVNQAKANMERDQAQLTRDQNLYSKGYVSLAAVQQDQATRRDDDATLDNANAQVASARSTVQANGTLSSGGLQQSTVQQSQAQVEVAQAQADQVKVQIEKATIVSPIDGVVVNRNFNPGEYPGTRQFSRCSKWIRCTPSYTDRAPRSQTFTTGVRANIAAADIGSRETFSGDVVGVLNQINPGSTDFQVKVVVRNPFRRLRPRYGGGRHRAASGASRDADSANCVYGRQSQCPDGRSNRWNAQDDARHRDRRRRNDFGRERHSPRARASYKTANRASATAKRCSTVR